MRFAVRSLYRWSSEWTFAPETTDYPHLYEERIVLFDAPSNDEALQAAFEEAETYAKASNAEFLGRVDSFRYDEGDREIFSNLMQSSLDTAAFKMAFYRDSDTHKRLVESDRSN